MAWLSKNEKRQRKASNGGIENGGITISARKMWRIMAQAIGKTQNENNGSIISGERSWHGMASAATAESVKWHRQKSAEK